MYPLYYGCKAASFIIIQQIIDFSRNGNSQNIPLSSLYSENTRLRRENSGYRLETIRMFQCVKGGESDGSRSSASRSARVRRARRTETMTCKRRLCIKKRFCTACLTFLMIAALAAVTVFAAADYFTDGYMSITLDNGESIEIGVGDFYTDGSFSASAATNTVSVEGFSAYDAYASVTITTSGGSMEYAYGWDEGVTLASASASLAGCPYEYTGASSLHSSSVMNDTNPSDIRGDSISLG